MPVLVRKSSLGIIFVKIEGTVMGKSSGHSA